jgi:hypothetical protein
LFDCRLSLVRVHRPKLLQFLLVNGAVSPSVSLDLFVDVRRKGFSHISKTFAAKHYFGLAKQSKPLSLADTDLLSSRTVRRFLSGKSRLTFCCVFEYKI